MSNFIQKFYEMDPKTEELLFDATYLRNGMKVLIESPDLRANPRMGLAGSELDRARTANRWCTVSFLKVGGEFVDFIATYDDGIKRKRTYPVGCAWIVKKDSLQKPIEEPDVENARKRLVHELLQAMATTHPENEVPRDTMSIKYAEIAANSIMIGLGLPWRFTV